MRLKTKRERARQVLLSRCSVSAKRRFRDHREAVAALQQASNVRGRAREDGIETRRQEVRSYECTACKGWHLTSQPVWLPDRRNEAVLQSI
jgi:tRNA G26 N,N-dimethylase Trm1